MNNNRRNGCKKSRAEISNRRKPELGYYLIVTDTEGTEKVYFEGLRDSIKTNAANKLIIKVLSNTKTSNLVKDTIDIAAKIPQFAERWIVFDRDQVINFDEIINEAANNDIKVAWSNPCIETWFNAYFGKMPNINDSQKCCSEFKKEFKKITKKEYSKTDRKIYQKLTNYGDENSAINIAENKLIEHKNNGKQLPSEKVPSTTMHKLIKEIKDKVTL